MVAAGRASSHAHTLVLRLPNDQILLPPSIHSVSLCQSYQAFKQLQSLSRGMNFEKNASKNGMLSATVCLAYPAMYHACESAIL